VTGSSVAGAAVQRQHPSIPQETLKPKLDLTRTPLVEGEIAC